ncbi:MAG: DUF2934 domain-containing protein [Planctomycetes bacterium]|jgi:hypothetical protein|nr:DUF2934 domain-containing protein [Planctomycetota bacterium]
MGAKRGRGAKVEKLRPEETPRAVAQAGPTQALIAQRAREIWERNGYRPGEDEKNWREAETELRRELGLG